MSFIQIPVHFKFLKLQSKTCQFKLRVSTQQSFTFTREIPTDKTFHLQAHCWKTQACSWHTKPKLQAESLRMHGWILCHRNVNNRPRLSLAVYNSYQNVIIPQSRSPFRYQQSSSGFHPFDGSVKSLLGVFCSSEQRSVMFVFRDHRKEPSTCCFTAAVGVPISPVDVFFMCLTCCLFCMSQFLIIKRQSSIYTVI